MGEKLAAAKIAAKQNAEMRKRFAKAIDWNDLEPTTRLEKFLSALPYDRQLKAWRRGEIMHDQIKISVKEIDYKIASGKGLTKAEQIFMAKILSNPSLKRRNAFLPQLFRD